MIERVGARESDGIEAVLSGLVATQLGVGVRRVEPLAAQLALRRFYRLHLDGDPGCLVARVEAPEDPAWRPAGVGPEPPLEPLRGFLEAAGLPVPARFGGDPARGIDLLEDLGARTLEEAVAGADAASRRALYAEACALVPRLQALRDPSGRVPAFDRRLGDALFAYKAALFAEESLPEALGRPARPAERQVVAEAFAWIAAACAQAPARLAHRDFQSRNLIVRGAGAPAPLAMIDLQGAFLAPPEYDLVCLLRDSYVELPWAEVTAHVERVRPALPDAPAPEVFARRFDWLSLTRKGKDHARFLQAARRRGDRRFLPCVPATVRALHAAARRAAADETRLERLAELVLALPEEGPSCAP